MTEQNTEKTLNKRKLLYSAAEKPPTAPLIFSSLQHMLLMLSLGMALPVAAARAAGLSIAFSGTLLAAALFGMGLTCILQTVPGKFIGSGYQSMSTCDSAAIAACVLAAEAGGIPLVLGMTLFAALIRFVLGSFAFKTRKLFPPEVTGTMIFILGINLVPTSFKYFLGSADAAGFYDPMHIIIAVATLIFMLLCALFIKPLRPYTALAGIVFGYALSAVTGFFDFPDLGTLQSSFVALPIYADLSFSFDVKMIVPFAVIAVAGVVDNIGDFSACQNGNDPDRQKPDWHSIERGIRGGALGTALSALIGGATQSTATTNIGIANAAGITSRRIAYVAGIMLMVVSFFPGITNMLSMIPEPVLGAVLMYSMCYIMLGGFTTLASRELDDKRIFTIFLSVGAAISTLIPGLYSFLPENVSEVLATPMVMGVCVVLFITLLGRIGTRKKFAFTTDVDAESVKELNKEIEKVCRSWATDKMLLRKLQLSLNSICEGLYEQAPATRLHFAIAYDQMQIKLHLETANSQLSETASNRNAEDISSLAIALGILPNMFENVRTKWQNGALCLDMDADL